MNKKGNITESRPLIYKKVISTAKLLLDHESSAKRMFGFYLLTAVTTGLRVSDVKQLTHGHFKRGEYSIREIKTSKSKKYKFHSSILEIYHKLFQREQGIVFKGDKQETAWSTWHINNQLKFYFGTNGVSSHSLRKTFGTRYYEQSKNKEDALYDLNIIFRHKDMPTTRIYIGIARDKIESNCEAYFTI